MASLEPQAPATDAASASASAPASAASASASAAQAVDAVLLATTPGLEAVCARELAAKLGGAAEVVRAGTVRCRVPADQLPSPSALLSLRSPEHAYAEVFSGALPELKAGDPEAALAAVFRAVAGVPAARWRGAVALWAASAGLAAPPPAAAVTFKVLKKRSGKHAFSSTALAQGCFRAVANAQPEWEGVLEEQRLSVMVRAADDRFFVGLCLGGASNATLWAASAAFSSAARAFGRTPLRPPVAYGLVALAAPRPGALVIDPLCGCGTVGELAAREGPVFALSGDSNSDACAKAQENARRLAGTPADRVDVVQWDAARLPLRDGCADCVATDLPFGKKCDGSGNKALYASFFADCRRVVRQGGAVVALSADRGSLRDGVRHSGLAVRERHGLNLGGLNAEVVVLEVGTGTAGGGSGAAQGVGIAGKAVAAGAVAG